MSRATNDYRRAELAQARSARRSRREQENYFRRTPPEQQRADNVSRAMADGSFHKTRFAFNQENTGRAEMDAAGNIKSVTAPPQQSEPSPKPASNATPPGQPPPAKPSAPQQPQQSGSGLDTGSMYGAPKAGEKRAISSPYGSGSSKFAATRKPVTKAPSPNYSGVADPTNAPAPAAKTAGEMIADIDRTIADTNEINGRVAQVFKPRAPAVATAPDNVTPAGRQKIIEDAFPSRANTAQPPASPKAVASAPPAAEAPKQPSKPGFFAEIGNNIKSHFGGSPLGQEASKAAGEIKSGASALASGMSKVNEGIKATAKPAVDLAAKVPFAAGQAVASSPGFQGSQMQRTFAEKAKKPSKMASK